MTFHDDDARATAYVFDELDGAERAAFERRLLTDGALREQVDALRETAGALTAALTAAPVPALRPEQRARIVVHGRRAEPAHPGGRLHRLRLPVFAASAAAVLVAVLTNGAPFGGESGRATEFATTADATGHQHDSTAAVTESGIRSEFEASEALFGAAIAEGRDARVQVDSAVPALVLADRPTAKTARELRADDLATIPDSGASAGTDVSVVESSRTYADMQERNAALRSEASRLRFLVWTSEVQKSVTDGKTVRPQLEVRLAEAANTVKLRYDVGQRLELLAGNTLPDGGNLATLFPQTFTGFRVQSQGGAAFDLTAPTDVAAATALSTVLLDGVDLPQVQRLLETMESTRRTVEQARPVEPSSNESYATVTENPFVSPTANPFSTFAVDVDSASFTNVRRMILAGQRPPAAAVRVEEFVNAFDYHDPAPTDGSAFAADVEVAQCPWTSANLLVRVGLKAREVPRTERPPSNLVFLIDTSGSMADADKLPLLQQSMKLLVRGLGEDDHVGIVTYADAARAALAPVSCATPETVTAAIDALHAQGSTNGADGLRVAYDMAAQNFRKEGVNRVILATDGDFNVGVTERDALTALITEKAKSNVYLTVLGFGTGNLKDDTLERLADRGNGHYAYVDSLDEAHRVLVEQAGTTLQTVAKDVKVQIEFNPVVASSYRLIGYENRALAARDFADDTKDGGEIGAGHAVTAFYEVVPNLTHAPDRTLDYQHPGAQPTELAQQGYLLTLHLRAKQPDGTESAETTLRVKDDGRPLSQASADFKFSSAVAAYALILRGSAYKGDATLDQVMDLASQGLGDDPRGRRVAFLDLVRRTKDLLGR